MFEIQTFNNTLGKMGCYDVLQILVATVTITVSEDVRLVSVTVEEIVKKQTQSEVSLRN